MQLGKMDDPTAGNAADIRHVDVQRIYVLAGENLFRFRSGRKSREIGRTGTFRGIFDGDAWIGPPHGGLRSWNGELPCSAEAGHIRVWPGAAAADGNADRVVSCSAA